MTIPYLTTRSLARVSLLASVLALGLCLGALRRMPLPSLPAALAAAPKTELRRTLHTHDAAAARAYYLAQKPEDLTTYTHPVYGFSLHYPKDFTVQDVQDDRGALVLMDNPGVGMGLQMFITPDAEPEPLTLARIRHDLPDMAIQEEVEFALADGTPAVRFVSRDPVLGDVGETWFQRNGQVFQLSVVAPDRELQDAWLRDLTAELYAGDDLLP